MLVLVPVLTHPRSSGAKLGVLPTSPNGLNAGRDDVLDKQSLGGLCSRHGDSVSLGVGRGAMATQARDFFTALVDHFFPSFFIYLVP